MEWNAKSTTLGRERNECGRTVVTHHASHEWLATFASFNFRQVTLRGEYAVSRCTLERSKSREQWSISPSKKSNIVVNFFISGDQVAVAQFITSSLGH
jgi:hypothetical protein